MKRAPVGAPVQLNDDTLSLSCDPASYRARRIRRAARRQLDELLAPHCCRCCATSPRGLVDRGDWWRDTGMDLGVPERDYAGRMLAASGWCP